MILGGWDCNGLFKITIEKEKIDQEQLEKEVTHSIIPAQ